MKVKAFFVSNNFEKVTLKTTLAKAMVKPAVAFEFDFDGSSVIALAVAANGANDFTLVRVTTIPCLLEEVMRVVSVDFGF